MVHVYGVVLASGFSRRFGEDKLSQDLCGKPVLQWCIDQLLSSGVDCVCIVTRDSMKERDLGGDDRLKFVINDDPAAGMSRSIRAALTKLEGNPDAVMIVNGDMPFYGAENYRKLIALWEETDGGIAASYHSGETMPPSIFSRKYFSDLLALEGDRGAKKVIHKNVSEVKYLSIEDPDCFTDIDTMEDLVYARSMCNHLVD